MFEAPWGSGHRARCVQTQRGALEKVSRLRVRIRENFEGDLCAPNLDLEIRGQGVVFLGSPVSFDTCRFLALEPRPLGKLSGLFLRWVPKCRDAASDMWGPVV